MRLFLIAAMAVFFSGAANAGILTFDQIDCSNSSAAYLDDVQEQGVTWSAKNYRVYGHCSQDLLIGDDGWFHTAEIKGSGFSVQSFEWRGSTFVTDPSVPFVTAEGYRNGSLVVSDTISAADLGTNVTSGYFSGGLTGSGNKVLNGFTNLDSVKFVLNQTMDWHNGLSGPSPHCAPVVPNGYHQCGRAQIDNIVINSISAVPLPASGVLLGFGLLGFGVLKRRKSAA